MYPKHTNYIAALFTLFLTVIFAYAYFSRGITDCGCMGSLVTIPPAISFARNILIIIGCYWVWKNSDAAERNLGKFKLATVFIIGALSFALAGYTLSKPMYDKIKIEVGDVVQTSFLRFYDQQLNKGTNFVFIFGPNCGHCWNATENVKSIKRTPGFEQVIGITFPNADISNYMEQMRPNFQILKYPTNEIFSVVRSVPILLMIENGRVVRVFSVNEIPNGPMLKGAMHASHNHKQ
jgi:hypothetical protein